MITSKDYDERIISKGIQHQIDNYYQPKDNFSKRRIDIILKILDPKLGENILDVGCGVGTFVFHSARFGARAYGIDYSRESLKVANELCVRFGVKQNTGFILGSAIALPFRNECFDKIVAADFIEHITFKEKEELLKEIYRVLKPEGALVVFTPNGIRERIGDFYWRVRNLLFGDRIPFTELHYGLINRGAFEKICKENNFKFKLAYEDTTRPYLAKILLLRHILALNLLWVIKKAYR